MKTVFLTISAITSIVGGILALGEYTICVIPFVISIVCYAVGVSIKTEKKLCENEYKPKI